MSVGRSLRKQEREAGRAEPGSAFPGVGVPHRRRADLRWPRPRSEAGTAGEVAALVNDRRAVYGDQPPRGFTDGGADPHDVARMQPRRV